MRILLAVLAMIIGAAVAAALAGSSRWHKDTAAAVAKLSPPDGRDVYREQSLRDLPLPVQRYFHKALKDGQPIVRSAIATQDAEFFINGNWRPLRATQHFVTTPPGFVWDAVISMAPLLGVSVRDAYVDGRGAMQATMYGVYSLADLVDTPELNSGALQRYLGEAVWFPTALLPSATVSWAARDDRSAVATLVDGTTTVSLLFEFAADGMVTAMSGDRYKEDGGRFALQPWQIHCEDSGEQAGLTIPTRCEVAWINGGRREPYWRGRISAIDYQFN